MSDASIGDLRKQLELERGLREAADAENERLIAQIESYAEDLGRLYQERHGHGRGGLAAEIETLRANLADEAARSRVLGQAYQKVKQEATSLDQQLVAYGQDLAQAFRRGQATAGGGAAQWWRKPLPLGLLTSASGLLVGGLTYVALVAPSMGPPPGALEVTGTALASALASPVQIISSGEGTPLDPVAAAGTAAAVAAAGETPDATGTRRSASSAPPPGTGTPRPLASGSATGTASVPIEQTVTAVAIAVATLSAGETALAQTRTALEMTGTVVAMATPISSTGTMVPGDATQTETATATATAARIDGTPIDETRRCSFEMLVPPLMAGEGFVVEFRQDKVADVLVLWSNRLGAVRLEGSAGTIVDRRPDTRDDVLVADLPPGTYRARLRNLGADALAESRVALFYDEGSYCRREPIGYPDSERQAISAPTPMSLPIDTATSVAASTSAPTALATASAPPSPTVTAPPPTPTLTAAPTAPPPSPTPTSIPASPTATGSPTPPPRPYVDCRPLLNGPAGYIEVRPVVWLDTQHTQRGTLALRAVITGPGVDSATDILATPEQASTRLQLGGYGVHRFRVTAADADLDQNCTWDFERTQYF